MNTLLQRVSLGNCRDVPCDGEVSKEASRVGMPVKGQRGTTELLKANEEPLTTPDIGSPPPLLPLVAPASPLNPSIWRDATCWPAQGTHILQIHLSLAWLTWLLWWHRQHVLQRMHTGSTGFLSTNPHFSSCVQIPPLPPLNSPVLGAWCRETAIWVSELMSSSKHCTWN